MKAISLWQPWASLWCSPRKVHETRHWPTDFRGWLLVHASKRFVKTFENDLPRVLREEFGANWFRDLPTGAIIGRVYLADCAPTASLEHRIAEVASPDDLLSGNLGPHRFAWRREQYQLFKKPIPYVGRQGFFNVADDVVGEAMPA